MLRKPATSTRWDQRPLSVVMCVYQCGLSAGQLNSKCLVSLPWKLRYGYEGSWICLIVVCSVVGMGDFSIADGKV